jgi:Arc/MetJ-type ribon-helix-helix transcriptional regulator
MISIVEDYPMAQSPILEVTLSEQALNFVRSKVASGIYSSEAEAVSQLIDDLSIDQEEDAALEREEVLAAYAEFLAEPASAISIEQVRRDLQSDMRQRLKAS